MFHKILHIAVYIDLNLPEKYDKIMLLPMVRNIVMGVRSMIAVIDYGAGNLQSVVKAFHYIGTDCLVTKEKEQILNCEGAVLPGVGSFGDAMDSMHRSGAFDAVNEFISTGKPFLGICLGLQLLFGGSEESPGVKGMNLLGGSITKIPDVGGTLKIPHMGWNSLNILRRDGLYAGIEGEPYVYFIHSYFLKAEDAAIVSARTEYGTSIDASVQSGNIYATQFHPEKSGTVGLQILRNFVNITGGIG